MLKKKEKQKTMKKTIKKPWRLKNVDGTFTGLLKVVETRVIACILFSETQVRSFGYFCFVHYRYGFHS